MNIFLFTTNIKHLDNHSWLFQYIDIQCILLHTTQVVLNIEDVYAASTVPSNNKRVFVVAQFNPKHMQ